MGERPPPVRAIGSHLGAKVGVWRRRWRWCGNGAADGLGRRLTLGRQSSGLAADGGVGAGVPAAGEGYRLSLGRPSRGVAGGAGGAGAGTARPMVLGVGFHFGAKVAPWRQAAVLVRERPPPGRAVGSYLGAQVGVWRRRWRWCGNARRRRSTASSRRGCRFLPPETRPGRRGCGPGGRRSPSPPAGGRPGRRTARTRVACRRACPAASAPCGGGR